MDRSSCIRSKRIEHIEGLEMYVPKLEYKVVAINGYTAEELQKNHKRCIMVAFGTDEHTGKRSAGRDTNYVQRKGRSI